MRAMSSDASATLASIRVLDLTDERAIYGSKLLADLGADVIRVERPEGDPLRRRGPFAADSSGDEHSLYYAYYGSNRRSVALDLDSDDGRERLRRLALASDVVIETEVLAGAGIEGSDLLEAKPELVVVSVSSFGSSGPWSQFTSTDLVSGALGGFVATTGDVDTKPLNGYGELHHGTTGAYAAIGALSALHYARETGEGQIVELAVHEAVASCLEHVLMWAWHHEVLPFAEGDVLPRRASLHWSDAYEVMAAQGGSVMVTVTPDPMKQMAWLLETGAEADLLDPRYQDPEQPRAFGLRMMEVLRDWVANWEVEEFFFEAQRRHFPYGWVLSPDRVAASPQLEDRGWWAEYVLGDRTVRGPGAPYRLEESPVTHVRRDSSPGGDTAEVLAEIGWDA
jgi:crotonobetainyl-CoA:carnitine CoA-transferase CaiB-like acyl-CoA transferase